MLKRGSGPAVFVAAHILDKLWLLFYANKKYPLENTKSRNLTYGVKWFFLFRLVFFKKFASPIVLSILTFKPVVTAICHEKS